MKHSPAFLAAVSDAKSRVRECDVASVRTKLEAKAPLVLVDVREDDEWRAGHARGSIHLGKGIIERDIEAAVPDPSAEVDLYCGGGFRSALAADALQKMGYRNVWSMAGGIAAWRQAGYPEEK